MNPNRFKRSIVLDGHKTSISLEDEFWKVLREIACQQKTKLSTLVSQVDQTRNDLNLSSAIRLFVLTHLRGQISNAPHSPMHSRGQSVELSRRIPAVKQA